MLVRSLVNNFLIAGKITTTETKAKVLRPVVEKMITRGKQDTVANRRLLSRELTPAMVKKVFGEVSPRYKDRQGGYTRITKLGPRMSDGAKMAVIELV